MGQRIAGVGSMWIGLYLAVSLIVLAAAAADPPHVPVEELPPFPDIVEETGATEVAVVGASAAGEDVVIAASKREQSLGSVASAVTVITADRLRRWGYRTLAEALRSVAGLHIADDRAIERIGIRGVQLLGDANTRVLILIDGSPVNEPWSQSVDTSHALPVHLDEVARL
ncbi:MAG TPA: TonB-dependent receptor plug domain-containing protein, partial [Kofleriaceae bacterium]|nr:TonB-dependent receptor plug domain-containing protein [Kofleriaceae bacterium]